MLVLGAQAAGPVRTQDAPRLGGDPGLGDCCKRGSAESESHPRSAESGTHVGNVRSRAAGSRSRCTGTRQGPAQRSTPAPTDLNRQRVLAWAAAALPRPTASPRSAARANSVPQRRRARLITNSHWRPSRHAAKNPRREDGSQTTHGRARRAGCEHCRTPRHRTAPRTPPATRRRTVGRQHPRDGRDRDHAPEDARRSPAAPMTPPNDPTSSTRWARGRSRPVRPVAWSAPGRRGDRASRPQSRISPDRCSVAALSGAHPQPVRPPVH